MKQPTNNEERLAWLRDTSPDELIAAFFTGAPPNVTLEVVHLEVSARLIKALQAFETSSDRATRRDGGDDPRTRRGGPVPHARPPHAGGTEHPLTSRMSGGDARPRRSWRRHLRRCQQEEGVDCGVEAWSDAQPCGSFPSTAGRRQRGAYSRHRYRRPSDGALTAAGGRLARRRNPICRGRRISSASCGARWARPGSGTRRLASVSEGAVCRPGGGST